MKRPDHDPIGAVRRAAIAALSLSELVDDRSIRVQIELAERAGERYEFDQESTWHIHDAMSLVYAYATLAQVEVAVAMSELLRQAEELFRARQAADARWMRLCRLTQDSLLLSATIKQAEDPILLAYATAAGTPYPVACDQIWRRHWQHCHIGPHHTGLPPLELAGPDDTPE